MRHLSRKLIEQLPKTDLHCHLDGSLRIDTLIELAKKNGVELFSYEPEALMEHMNYGRVRGSLGDYLVGFDPLIAVLQSPEDLERVFFEVCEDAHAENVWHLELRYCPYLHIKNKLKAKEVVLACIKAARRAEQEFKMSVGHIICGLKQDPPALNLEMAKLAVDLKEQGVLGFDLAGPEVGFPVREHSEALYLAKRNHLSITIHGGENSGPENIYENIHEGFANRIGHGTSLIKDERLLEYVVNHRIGIESCPKSNWHTGSVKSLKDHPIKAMLNRGVRVSINTDNRLCSDTTVTEEIMTVMEELDLGIDELRRLLVNGFKSSFLPYNLKTALLENFNAEWDRLMGLD